MSLSSRRWITLTVCSLLLLAFALACWSAARRQCATYDEPLHAVAGFVLSHDGDYRLNPEDPPLWERWANVLEPRSMLHVDKNAKTFKNSLYLLEQRYDWIKPTLYPSSQDPPAPILFPQTPTHADEFLMRQRIMLIPLGVILGVVIALWSWQLAGPIAAIAAASLFALDPNFLANAAMIKNDVAITLVGFALSYVTWRMGRRLSITSAAAVILLAAIGMVTKFSWPLLMIALMLLLLLRVVIPWSWAWRKKQIQKRRPRLSVALGLLIILSLVGYVMIWANYSFRFAPTPDGHHWAMEPLLMETEVNELSVGHPDRKSTLEELQAWRPHGLVSAALYLGKHHVLPETYLYGLIYTYRSSRLRSTFLCGDYGVLGHWYYFPLAFAFKMPLASLAAVCLSLGVAFSFLRRPKSIAFSWSKLWTAACLLIPAFCFAIAVMASNLNIGFRHFLPVMPFIYVGIAVAIAAMWNRWGRNGRLLIGGIAVGLLAETALAYPHFLAFFNQACGGPIGGIRLLGDANLDWGQDLPLLAAWQRDHPDIKLYISYFGAADPRYYGIKADSIVGDYSRPAAADLDPTQPGVIAVSATNLQGIYLSERDRKRYTNLAKNGNLVGILGDGTIYLYANP